MSEQAGGSPWDRKQAAPGPQQSQQQVRDPALDLFHACQRRRRRTLAPLKLSCLTRASFDNVTSGTGSERRRSTTPTYASRMNRWPLGTTPWWRWRGSRVRCVRVCRRLMQAVDVECFVGSPACSSAGACISLHVAFQHTHTHRDAGPVGGHRGLEPLHDREERAHAAGHELVGLGEKLLFGGACSAPATDGCVDDTAGGAGGDGGGGGIGSASGVKRLGERAVGRAAGGASGGRRQAGAVHAPPRLGWAGGRGAGGAGPAGALGECTRRATVITMICPYHD